MDVGGQLDVVAVDPGHVTLIDAVRYHTAGVVPAEVGESKRAKRRAKLQTKLADRNLT